MKLHVKVKAKSKVPRVVKIDETHFKVWVQPAPEKGRANEAVIEALSEFLGAPKSTLSIVSGHSSAQKVIESSSP